MTTTHATGVDRGPRLWAIALAFLLITGIVAAVAALGLGPLRAAGQAAPTGPVQSSGGTVYNPAVAAPALRLTDADGHAFDLESLRGTPAIVYFGYTHCPDVCPATIGVLNKVLATYEGRVRIVFVSIDPERDTVASMRAYLDYLDPAYVGLTGSASDIRAAAAAWGVTYARVETGSASGYAMAHTADQYLVGPDGRRLVRYPFGTEAAAIVADLDRLAR